MIKVEVDHNGCITEKEMEEGSKEQRDKVGSSSKEQRDKVGSSSEEEEGEVSSGESTSSLDEMPNLLTDWSKDIRRLKQRIRQVLFDPIGIQDDLEALDMDFKTYREKWQTLMTGIAPEKPKEEAPKPSKEEAPKPSKEEAPKPSKGESSKPAREEAPKPRKEDAPEPCKVEASKISKEETPKPPKEDPKPSKEASKISKEATKASKDAAKASKETSKLSKDAPRTSKDAAKSSKEAKSSTPPPTPPPRKPATAGASRSGAVIRRAPIQFATFPWTRRMLDSSEILMKHSVIIILMLILSHLLVSDNLNRSLVQNQETILEELKRLTPQDHLPQAEPAGGKSADTFQQELDAQRDQLKMAMLQNMDLSQQLTALTQRFDQLNKSIQELTLENGRLLQMENALAQLKAGNVAPEGKPWGFEDLLGYSFDDFKSIFGQRKADQPERDDKFDSIKSMIKSITNGLHMKNGNLEPSKRILPIPPLKDEEQAFKEDVGSIFDPAEYMFFMSDLERLVALRNRNKKARHDEDLFYEENGGKSTKE